MQKLEKEKEDDFVKWFTDLVARKRRIERKEGPMGIVPLGEMQIDTVVDGYFPDWKRANAKVAEK